MKLAGLLRSSSRDQTYDWWNENGQAKTSERSEDLEGGAHPQTGNAEEASASNAGKEVEAMSTARTAKTHLSHAYDLIKPNRGKHNRAK